MKEAHIASAITRRLRASGYAEADVRRILKTTMKGRITMKFETTQEQVSEMKRRLLVMEAFLKGRQIESCLKREGVWHVSNDPNDEPAWDWNYCDYRVKGKQQ